MVKSTLVRLKWDLEFSLLRCSFLLFIQSFQTMTFFKTEDKDIGQPKCWVIIMIRK